MTVLSVLGVSAVIVIIGFLGGVIFSRRLTKYRRRKAKKMHTCRTAVFARDLDRGESVRCVIGIDGNSEMSEKMITVSTLLLTTLSRLS